MPEHAAKTTRIKNGRVIDPASGVDWVGDVFISDGQIAAAGAGGGAADCVIDAEGLIVCPGLIDMHTHLREPGQTELESIETGSAAAVAGGFTSIACMPNTDPPLDNEAAIEFVIRQGDRAGLCNVFPLGAITRGREGRELAELGRMVHAGAVGFTDDGCGVASASVMQRALQYSTMFDKPIIQHCEDPEIGGSGVMNAGPTAMRLGLPGLPAKAEDLMVQRDILLTAATGARYHVSHISTANAVEMVRRAGKHGLRVTAEVTPHHLLLTEECLAGYDSCYKMKPPLRRQADVDACIEGVRDGTITALATDHAPHSIAGKELEFQLAPFGIIGLETALAMYIRALILPKVVDWPALIRLMTTGPAGILGLAKGTLQPGSDADVTLIDPMRKWTVDAARFKSKARNCPWSGENVVGKAVMTLVDGRIKYCEDADRARIAGTNTLCHS